jgi:hypothetical protein
LATNNEVQFLQAFYLLLGALFRHELMIIWWEQAMLEVTLASYGLE